jgi:probable rRNA maturation factor
LDSTLNMEINFFNEDLTMPEFNQSAVSAWIDEVICAHELHTGCLNFIFCSNNYLLKINQDFLNHDYYTDVITFDYCENKRVSGDVYISVEMVKENADKLAQDSLNELLRVIIHGVLHLCGYNDKTKQEKDEMTQQENLALTQFLG